MVNFFEQKFVLAVLLRALRLIWMFNFKLVLAMFLKSGQFDMEMWIIEIFLKMFLK